MERGSTITKQQKTDDDVVLPTELRHRIQSLLSEEEAGRTCVLSKSWHHAWSTIPNLRFPDNRPVTTDLIYNTIQRYHDDNIPIEALKFCIKVNNLELDEIQIRRILGPETSRCLKELSLTITSGYSWWGSVFVFTDDLLFSGENLQTINLKSSISVKFSIKPVITPVIKCVALRVLNLERVIISEEVFHSLLSTCSLLEKVILCCCRGLKIIKVKNLGCLRQLKITSFEDDGLLEIDNVPSLGFLYYKRRAIHRLFKLTDAMASSLGRSVTRLHLEGTIINHTFFNMIESKFPFLESLELEIGDWAPKRLVITSRSLKRLALRFVGEYRWRVYVYAPNLLSFYYHGKTELPTLLFPIIAPKEIKLSLYLWDIKPFDTSFFLKLREVLNLSTKFDIYITILSSGVPLSNDDVENLRRQVSVSDATVQQLSLTKAGSNNCPWEGTRFFDALFSICHPAYVKVSNRFIPQITVSMMMENNTTDLKQVLMKNPLSGSWEALTSSCETDFPDVEYKLNWFSHD